MDIEILKVWHYIPKLESFGLDVHRGLGKTGVVGTLLAGDHMLHGAAILDVAARTAAEGPPTAAW